MLSGIQVLGHLFTGYYYLISEQIWATRKMHILF